MEGFRPGERLCHGRSRRGGSRGGRTGPTAGIAGAALAALSLIVLSGCSGAADAAPTVGPTAGADETAEPTEYEPTLPPYTSEVDLSAEEEAEVEELLLLIDEFTEYTSGISERHEKGLLSRKENIEKEIYRDHEEFIELARRDSYEINGSVEIARSSVWRFESGDYAMIGICYDHHNWGVEDPDDGGQVDDYPHERDGLRMAYIEAERNDAGWEIYNQKFYDIEDGCDGL